MDVGELRVELGEIGLLGQVVIVLVGVEEVVEGFSFG